MMQKIFALCALLYFPVSALALEGWCSSDLTNNGFGRPLDYNSTNSEEQYQIHNNVERNHFTTDVEALIRGKSGALANDLTFTLRAIPNHYRALDAMGRWQLKNPQPTERDGFYGADCFFERALLFKPQDPLLHMMYGIYLHKAGKFAEALERYKRSELLDPNSVELQYNLGLVHLELGNNDLALEYAKRAYAGQYPLPGLRNRLEKKGLWKAQEVKVTQ